MLAWRNLIHDKVRLAVTLTGIVFAVVLIVVEFGLFFGFTTTTSSLIDRSGADLWIIASRVPYIELAVPFTERKLSAALATPGVAEAEKYVGGLRNGSVLTVARRRSRSSVSTLTGRWEHRGTLSRELSRT